MQRTQGKLLVFLLAAVLLAAPVAPARGETLSQLRQQVAQGWRQTYTQNGRTVTVDIPVQVPDTETLPVLRAVAAPPLTRPVITTWPDATLFQDTGFIRLDSHSPKTVQQISRASLQEPPGGMDVQPVYREGTGIDWDTAYAYNNPGTVREAHGMLTAVWADQFPDVPTAFTPCAVYATGAMRTYDAVSGAFTGDPWPYAGVLMVYFHQMIGGIPVLCQGNACFQDFDHTPLCKQGTPTGGVAILQRLADDSGMFYSAQYHLLTVQETLLDNLPLCALETVLQSCEELIARGMLRQVSSLQLGYAAWQAEDQTYFLTPVWALTGDLYADADTPDRVITPNMDPRQPEHGMLLFSAMTGELADPARLDLGALYP